MPRPRAIDSGELLQRAMRHFWAYGYHGSSIRDLVAATGASRYGLYGDFEDKETLFEAALATYRDEVVSAAFDQVEAEGANLASIAAYFEQQIRLAEIGGLPGPGCFLANTMVGVGPHDARFQAAVEAHLVRLTAGFRHALGNASDCLASADLDELAEFLTISAQGLWSFSRTVKSAAPLRRYVAQLMSHVERGLQP